MTNTAYSLKIESRVPPGAIVLSGTSLNQALLDKKFSKLTGQNIGGYFLFQKSTFGVSNTSVPLLINYQGRLTAADGSTISGPVNLRFQMYDEPSDGNLLWSETITGVSTSTKIYNALLGAINPIIPDTFSGPSAFLQTIITQGATVQTLSPRTQITSVPYALQAEGTLPTSGIILGSTIGSLKYDNTGFMENGDKVGSYFLFLKKDVDITPPSLVVLQPQDGMTQNFPITVEIVFSDTLSGIDLSTLLIYHNDVDITSMLNVTDSGASGLVTGVTGGNVFNVWVADKFGNVAFDSSLVLIEDGTPPEVHFISPPEVVLLDSNTVTMDTNTPFFYISYNDSGSGVDLSSLEIMIDGIDRTSKFLIDSGWAIWQPTSEYAFLNGLHQIWVRIKDKYGNLMQQPHSFNTNSPGNNPDECKVSPNFTIGGDSVTITGTGFGNTASRVMVYFTGTPGSLGRVAAEIKGSVSPTEIKAIVPASAITGKVLVTVDGVGAGNSTEFTMGLPYAYIANRNSHKISVLDYRTNTFAAPIQIPGSNPTPYAADVTPDGHWLFVANYGTNTVTVINTLDNDTVSNINLRCKTPQPTNPQAIAISPDGSQAIVVSNNKVISVIETRMVMTNFTPLPGHTLCDAVENYSFTQGSSGYKDIEFTPDGARIVVPTDGSGTNAIVLSFDTRRWYLGNGDANSNDSTVSALGTYLHIMNSLTLAQDNANRAPTGVEILPQRETDTPGEPWRILIANRGSTSDLDEDSVLLKMPSLTHDTIIDTNAAGHPVCYGAEDVAVSPLGLRAFFGFNFSNNIGLSEYPVLGTAIESATAARSGCPPTCSGTGTIHEIAYTPYLDKVLATIWWSDAANSKVMILDANSIAFGSTVSTIKAAYYTFVQDPASLNGPEGIGTEPLFDRDGDKISDIIEARNQGLNTVNFNPTLTDSNPSQANTNPMGLSDGILLPEEGIGYRHFYGTDAVNMDNWGTLKLIQVIEAVGREWYLKHPEGPRFSINDLSERRGGQMCWIIPTPGCHVLHQNGLSADIRYIRNDESEGQCNAGDPCYSQTLTQELISIFCSTGLINEIYINRDANITQISGCNLNRNRTDHVDHFHVQINN